MNRGTTREEVDAIEAFAQAALLEIFLEVLRFKSN